MSEGLAQGPYMAEWGSNLQICGCKALKLALRTTMPNTGRRKAQDRSLWYSIVDTAKTR